MIHVRTFAGERVELPAADLAAPAGVTTCWLVSPVEGFTRTGVALDAVVLDESYTMAHEPPAVGGDCCEVEVRAGGKHIATVQILRNPRR